MITLHACTTCGHTIFPARLLCARCGGSAWNDVSCENGVVAAVTTVQQTILAELRTPQNIRIIARLPHATPLGTSVALHETEDRILWGI